MTLFSDRPGAVTGDGAIEHFGDPMREQRALVRGLAVAPLGDRAIIEVAGEDRLTWLDSITSQEVKALGAGESTELLVLDPQGRIEHAAGIVDDGASAWLLAESAQVSALATWLSRMVFRSRVSVSVRDDLFALGFFAGGAAERVATAAAIVPAGVPVVWADPWESVRPGGHQYADQVAHPASDYRWRVAVATHESAAALTAIDLAGTLAAEALRVAAWRPRQRGEVDDRSLPHEYDWLRSAVHLSKGCYRGQETVAKVHNLGHPPRRMVALDLDGSAVVLPPVGSPVFAGDREVGHITSVARHYEDGPIALAIVSRRAPEGELVVHVDEARVPAGQRVIVPADAGATAGVPRITRLSRRPQASDAAAGGSSEPLG